MDQHRTDPYIFFLFNLIIILLFQEGVIRKSWIQSISA